MADLQTALRAIGHLEKLGGGSAEERTWLRMRPNGLSVQQVEALSAVMDRALRGFFEAATDGYEFVPRDRVLERFGNTVAGNYPEAGPAFLRFANTYWTLKMLLQDLWDYRETVAMQILDGIERQIGAVFFPTPGPIRIDPSKREATQRELLTELAPRIDVDEFIRLNPILQRDRLSSRSSGCASALTVALVASVAFVLLYWL